MQKGRLKDIGKSNGKRKLIYKSSYGQISDCEKYKSTGRRVMAFAGIFFDWIHYYWKKLCKMDFM